MEKKYGTLGIIIPIIALIILYNTWPDIAGLRQKALYTAYITRGLLCLFFSVALFISGYLLNKAEKISKKNYYSTGVFIGAIASVIGAIVNFSKLSLF